MIAKKEQVVRIIVEGPDDAREHGLLGLLREASADELRKAISYLAPSQVVRIAQVCHGRLYKMVKY